MWRRESPGVPRSTCGRFMWEGLQPRRLRPVGAEAPPTKAFPQKPRMWNRSLLTLRQRYRDAVQSLTSENLKLLRDASREAPDA